MTIPADTSQNYLLVEGRETVTLRIKTAEGVFDEYQVENAKRRVRSRFHQTMISQSDITWHLWQAMLPDSVVPFENCEIVDGVGVSWCIQKVFVESLQKRYRCECTQL